MRTTKVSIFIITGIVITAGILAARFISDDSMSSSIQLDEARKMISSNWPLLPADRRTTDGAIYLNNLNGQIAALEKWLQNRDADHQTARLAQLYYHRFQITGRLADAEKARNIAAQARDGQHSADLDLIYARVLLGFHDFDLAAAALDAAETKNATQSKIPQLRRELDQARGIQSVGDDSATDSVSKLVSRAAFEARSGRLGEASALLKAAQDRYIDTSPYVLAWIHVQQGIIFLDHNDFRSAKLFFTAAHNRFPQFTLAAEHLAETELELGNPEAAAQLYQTVAEISRHPEFIHQLGKAQRALGNEVKAHALFAEAREHYDRLVARYPLMYADHAVHYFIDVGDRESAVELAALNYAHRQSPEARELVVTAQECCR